MDLLEKDDKLLRKDEIPNIYYILTPKGHSAFDSWYRKILVFIFYDKSNIWVLLSTIISIGSLIVAVIALNK
jgi:hypothetical protein